MEASRRQFIQGSVSAFVGLAALKGLVFAEAEAQELRFTKAQLEALRARLKGLMEGLDVTPYLGGQHTQLFKRLQSERRVESVAHFAVGNNRSILCDVEHADQRERYLWNFEGKEIGLGFAATPDATDEELLNTLRAFCMSFQQYREYQAADVFNGGLTYDPTVGGDGVSLLSTRHPTDDSTWANTFPEYRPLTVESLREACAAIANGFVDDRNIKIMARARTLVVPVTQIATAERMACDGVLPPGMDGYQVNDYLQDPDSWYVLTNVEGLYHFERVGFEMDVWMPPWDWDPVMDKPVEIKPQHVLAKGYERYCFGCGDPRAIFGVMKQSIPHLKAPGLVGLVA